MNRKLEIINGLRVSKCGARHVGMKTFPAVIAKPTSKPEPVNILKEKEPEKKSMKEYSRKALETESREQEQEESLFGIRKKRHAVPDENEQ